MSEEVSLQKCYISDLDGTACDINHRLKYVTGNRKDWLSFNEAIPQDKPNQGVIDTINSWYETDKCVVLCSGRTDDTYTDTVEWLAKYGVNYDYLFMRKSGDYRKDSIIKEEFLFMMRDTYRMWPEFVLDDRPQVVEMWRKHGIMVGQVADLRPEPIIGAKPPMLIIMVGPSGAGKSHYIEKLERDEDVVSSDHIRYQLTGNSLDQSMNDRVFKALHHVVRERLHVGLTTIVDATNIRRKDRVAIKDLATPETEIHYYVFNRTMEEKIRDGGWRNEVPGLMERHENTFNQNLKYILNGDGDPRVIVSDMRWNK